MSKSFLAADSSKKLDDKISVSCTNHGEVGVSFWTSVIEYLIYAHDKREGSHEYEVKNEKSGISFNPFRR